MFRNSSFNGDISEWDVSSVTYVAYMAYMFSGASEFNQDLSGWCVQNISGEPNNFSTGATAWTLPKPVWGTCPKPLKSGDNISELTNDVGFVKLVTTTSANFDSIQKEKDTIYAVTDEKRGYLGVEQGDPILLWGE